MSSNALDPSGSSQPTLDQAYSTSGNPATTSKSEDSHAAHQKSAANESTVTEERDAHDQPRGNPTSSSLGRGIHGAPAGEEKYGRTEEDVGRHNELDGEQMSAPGEGRVRDAVVGNAKGKGGSGEQIDLASGLDRKKAEQAPAREAMKEQRAEGVDVGGVLGQTGGPANPVD
ncbi:hypothetical protein EJ05DRAFT_74313 [Pseudovirgaria hyperparasitica]|uniref:Uncharacterized protein n=1 Tax=Pseudovirgaria hyperparasitica TaxID=470096 RepID=A0A6A6W3J0_9PEZI|nr:uncharacterized protein EJ05DRAFT_74313 [Pseudovirgaria hyperparasitica]KAF2756709.1 hypothetical protein EJ05DRAFT_74313 [Pseudovirgaria hyperparasitica]